MATNQQESSTKALEEVISRAAVGTTLPSMKRSQPSWSTNRLLIREFLTQEAVQPGIKALPL